MSVNMIPSHGTCEREWTQSTRALTAILHNICISRRRSVKAVLTVRRKTRHTHYANLDMTRTGPGPPRQRKGGDTVCLKDRRPYPFGVGHRVPVQGDGGPGIFPRTTSDPKADQTQDPVNRWPTAAGHALTCAAKENTVVVFILALDRWP
jgi:hypothetical protein